MIWSHLFIPDVSLIEKIVRPLIVYWALILMLRLFGKRELAQLNANDLVVLLLISNTVQNAIIGPDNSVAGGLLGAFMLLAFNYVAVRFLYRHQGIDQLVGGKCTVLVENGKLLQHALDEEMITVAELETAAHKQGFDSLAQVDRATLEPGGSLTMTGRKPSDDDLRQDAVMQQLKEIKLLLQQRNAT